MAIGMGFLFGTMIMSIILIIRNEWIDINLNMMLYIFKNSVIRNIITPEEFKNAVDALPDRRTLITDPWHWKIGYYLTQETKQLILKIERGLLKLRDTQEQN